MLHAELDRLGTAALVRLFAAIAVFLLLHLLRIPLVLAARVLEHALRRIDRYATAQVVRVPAGPINHFATTAREGVHVYP
jgi:hypothetical protein